MISKNSIFNFKESPYYLEYEDTLFVDGVNTGDIFNPGTGEFMTRTMQMKNDTWKS
jgi:hypothetical protein